MHAAGVPQTNASSTPAKVSCRVNTAPVSDAEAALEREDYDIALDLYKKMAAISPDQSRAGVIRTLIEQSKVQDAESLAQAWMQEQPKSATAEETMSEALLRAGDIPGASQMVMSAHALDPCNARVYLMIGVLENLSANFASGKKQFELAHRLDPQDVEILDAWIGTLPRSRMVEEDAKLLQRENLWSAKHKAAMTANIAFFKGHADDTCEPTRLNDQVTLPMRPLMDGPNRRVGLALDVSFNGKGRRLQIDTGAYGITLSRGAAARLGLVHEQGGQTGGIGDKGDVDTSWAHVDSIRIGNLEYHNCAVRILEKRSALDVDGLIGGNFFNDFLLTLDFPDLQVRLNPLPKLPGQSDSPASGSSNQAGEKPSGDTGDKDAKRWHDRYIAPEMKNWTPVYRSGHLLLLPVRLGQRKERLFVVDTGSYTMLISPDAARDVTKVAHDYDYRVRGISGEVNKVYQTGHFTFSFAHLRQHVDNMTSIDTTKISHDEGIEISGFLGATVLNLLTVHIDYRDNLMLFEYRPQAPLVDRAP